MISTRTLTMIIRKKKHNEQKMTLTKNIYKNTNNDNDNKIAQ